LFDTDKKPRRSRKKAAAAAIATKESAAADTKESAAAGTKESAAGATKESAAADNEDSDSSGDDGIRFDKAVIESDDVRSLKADPVYAHMRKQTAKARAQEKKNNKFKEMRTSIRVNAAAARVAYATAAKAQPDTPDVRNMLEVNTLNSCHTLR